MSTYVSKIFIGALALAVGTTSCRPQILHMLPASDAPQQASPTPAYPDPPQVKSPTPATSSGGERAPQTSSSSTSSSAAVQAYPADCSIDASTELFITKISVVDDPIRTAWTGSTAESSDGAWALGRILGRLAASQDAGAYVSNWLAYLDADDAFLRTNWPVRNGKYDLQGSPMLLNAIVNRIDLRDPNKMSLGELRFVFGPARTSSAQGSVIIEIIVPQSAQYDILTWAQAWHQLGDSRLDSSSYNSALQIITDYALDHAGTTYRIRTANESAVSNWTFRQFEPDKVGALAPANLTFTPGHQYTLLNEFQQTALDNITGSPNSFSFLSIDPNDEAALSAYGRDIESKLPSGTYSVPDTYRGRPMATQSFTMLQLYFGESNALGNFRFDETWTIPSLDAAENAIFSLNTCNGCHSLENPPAQVCNRIKGRQAALSNFIFNTDPNSRFNEFERRQLIMADILCGQGAAATGLQVVIPKK